MIYFQMWITLGRLPIIKYKDGGLTPWIKKYMNFVYQIFKVFFLDCLVPVSVFDFHFRMLDVLFHCRIQQCFELCSETCP